MRLRYVGFDQGGLLTEAITKTPHCVLLLDEIEKAHPEVFNLLLQVMDHGTLTDNNGRKADFRNIILIMTTNAGAEAAARASIGFNQQDHTTDAMEVIKKSFTPEFRNRLDTIIQFGRLSTETIKSVVDKFLTELQAQLEDKRVQLEVSDRRAAGWRRRATTCRWVRDRWRGLSRTRSSGRWPRRSCSASWPSMAAWCMST